VFTLIILTIILTFSDIFSFLQDKFIFQRYSTHFYYVHTLFYIIHNILLRNMVYVDSFIIHYYYMFLLK